MARRATVKGASKAATQRGRPPGTSGTGRRKRVVTLMTDTEFEHLSEIAAQRNESMSSTCRQILVSYLAKQTKINQGETE
jgi:hypothetical protein